MGSRVPGRSPDVPGRSRWRPPEARISRSGSGRDYRLRPPPPIGKTGLGMNVKKGIITAAGPSQRTLPLQTLVDRDGVEKKALRIILEEAVSAGVEDVCVVVVPGDQDAYREAAGEYASHVHFVEQVRPL